MFRDARTLDVQRTAASFDTAMERYAAHQEDWFDGSVGSIDTRLAACNQLLHRVGATVARMNMTDAHRYLSAVEDLSADQAALQDLRYAMLTGAAGREEPEDHARGTVPGSPAEAWGHQRNLIDRAQGGDPAAIEEIENLSPDSWIYQRFHEGSRQACNDFDSDHHPKVPKTKLDKKQKLSGTDRRWVTLEAARFVAANASTCDDPHELATRA